MARMRSFRWFGGTVLAAFVVWLALALGAQAAGAPARYSPPGDKWTGVFRLEPGVTYTYVLSAAERGRPVLRFEERGRLNIWLAPGGSQEIRFSYTVGGVQRSGTAPNNPHALAGAVLLSALTGPNPLPENALRLLSTSLQWIQWADLFTESTLFRNGTVWEVYQNPPLRFTATRRANETYEGQVTLGRETLLELRIKLSEPLPERAVSYYAREVYRAELESVPQRRPLR